MFTIMDTPFLIFNLMIRFTELDLIGDLKKQKYIILHTIVEKLKNA